MQVNVDQVGLVSFSSDAELEQRLTHQASSVKQAIDQLWASGMTNITEAIETTQQELTSHRHNPAALPVIILLSDGQPTAGGDPAPPHKPPSRPGHASSPSVWDTMSMMI